MMDHERSHHDRHHHVSNGQGGALVGFIAGAAIGAGIALLLAPATGQETQRRIGDFARKVKSSVGNGAEKAASQIGDVKHDVKAAVAAGRDAYQHERDARRPDNARSQV